MGRSKLSRYVGMFLFAAVITGMIGFWWSRTSGSSSWRFWAHGLAATLIVVAACAAYMAAVGLYHTALAVLGLDGQPGIFSRGARSGPFSGPPEGNREPDSRRAEGADAKKEGAETRSAAR